MPKTAKKKTLPVVDEDQQIDSVNEVSSVTKQVELTKDGLEELTAELRELTDVKLPQVIDRVAKAREYGDLSENSEYHSARDEQQLVETRIDEIQAILSNAKLVRYTKSTDKVGIGSEVHLQQVGKKGEFSVQIVGEFESEPGENKISSVSPMGKALMGKKKGEVATVQAPAGETQYTIVNIR